MRTAIDQSTDTSMKPPIEFQLAAVISIYRSLLAAILLLIRESKLQKAMSSWSPAGFSSSVRNAGKQATERLAHSAREISHNGSAIRQRSFRQVEETRHLLKNETHRLIGTVKDAARGIRKAGRLKGTAAAFVVIHRMRTLAEAAKQAREEEKCKVTFTTHEGVISLSLEIKLDTSA